MEIQVENHETNIDLKLFLYGFGSFVSVYKFGVKLSVKCNVYMYINLFES